MVPDQQHQHRLGTCSGNAFLSPRPRTLWVRTGRPPTACAVTSSLGGSDTHIWELLVYGLLLAQPIYYRMLKQHWSTLPSEPAKKCFNLEVLSSMNMLLSMLCSDWLHWFHKLLTKLFKMKDLFFFLYLDFKRWYS